jgi:uncharacterized protein YegL
MPMVVDMLRDLFSREPDSALDPIEVVALGAAIQGAMLEEAKGMAPASVAKMLGGISSRDVSSHSLGTVTMKDGRLNNSIIIPKNSPIPAEMSRSDYVTSYDNQTSLDVYVIQGEESDPSCCTLLGAYEFYDIPERPAGKSQISISFKYNLDVMVEVEAKDISTGKALPKRVKTKDVSLAGLESSGALDIAMLIDASGSMSGGELDDAKAAVVSFLERIKGQVQVGLISFGDPDAHIRQQLTGDFTAVKAAAQRLNARGGTPMDKAISLANTEMLTSGGATSIMILLTDGAPNDPAATEEAAESAKAEGIRIIAIGVGAGVISDFLRRIASSPEDYHFVDESFNLSTTFTNIATELSHGIARRQS